MRRSIALILSMLSVCVVQAQTKTQKCESFNLTHRVLLQSEGKSTLVVIPEVDGDWRLLLTGQQAEKNTIDVQGLTVSNLSSGNYDGFLIDNKKRYCIQKLTISID